MEGVFKMRWGRLILLGYLLAAAAADLRKKTVSLPAALLAGVAAATLHVFAGDGAAWLAGCLPGMFLLGLAYVTRQSIGYGDGAALIVTGLFLGFVPAVTILMTALLLSCPVSLGLLIWKRDRKRTLPFVPFLAAAYLIWMAAGR